MRVDVEREIRDFVDHYIGLSHGMQFEAKRRCWDAAEPRPVLSPEEAPEPLVGWEALDRYWSGSRQVMSSLQTAWSDLRVNELAPDLVIACFKQRWTATMSGGGPLTGAPIAATVRASLLLRRREVGWRIVASVEAHVDGVEYFRDLYRRRAARARPWN